MSSIFKNADAFVTDVLGKGFDKLFKKVTDAYNAAVKKLKSIIKSPFKLLFEKPSSVKDYVLFGEVYVSKRLVLFVVLAAAFSVFFVIRFVLPYLEGRLWIPTIVINTEKFHTYAGDARVVSQEDEIIYAGALNNGEIVGYGVLYNGDSIEYKGWFLENNYNGVGTLYYPSGVIKFDGLFENGEYSEGIFFYENGTPCFDGTFENGAYKKGKLMYENGLLKFDGLFDDGLFKEGILYSEHNEPIYEGSFLNGLYDGMGREYENQQLKYAGEFANGKYNGIGQLYDGNFVLYDGEFLNGLYNGYGKLYRRRSVQLLYEGGFSAGLYEGDGVLYNGTRQLYTGSFSQGLYHGDGVLYNHQGRIKFTGSFYMGEIDYITFIAANTEAVREAFGSERQLVMLENTFLLYYSDMNTIFEFNFADENNEPLVQRIKLLGAQSLFGVRNGMTIPDFKRLFRNEIFTEYYFNVNSDEEAALSILGSSFVEDDQIYCIKSDLESLYIRAFAENEDGNIIYYEIGGI